ncbi:uncharacterized protein [Clytia hemisphaerica]|uniref:SET domain-containing protein n=1 Tax=Clytia hemisphaerica TaxID=252671 RepID=A0A7M5WLY9_9CNID
MPFQPQNFPPLQSMRMTDMILHELAIKANCKFNPEKKDNEKEISNTKDSMQCLVINNKETTPASDELNNHIKEEGEENKQTVINSLPIKTYPKIRQNFIPYPDHNYGQQPPLTPPLDGKKTVITSKIGKENTKQEHSGQTDQDGDTRCICGFDHDDGYMICCDMCSSWQHIECMGIKSSKVPEKYSCNNCLPRELDVKRAKEIQAKKRENMSEDDDDEDDEGEETGSEEEPNKTSYTIKPSTEVSNTPTRITLQLSNNITTTNQTPITTTTVKKGRRGKIQRKKQITEQPRTTRRKTRKKDKSESANSEESLQITDIDSFKAYLTANTSYDSIVENECDDELKNMHFKLPEVVPHIDLKNIVKCHHLAENNKGVVASSSIASGNLILEYIGTLMSLKKFEDQNPNFQHNCPFVIKYMKIEPFPIVIDARKNGNDARFLRRSCQANAELRHLTHNGSLHIMVISVVEILQNQEITVPFDPDSDLPGYIDCACGQKTCPMSIATPNTKKDIIPKKESPISERTEPIINTEEVLTKTEMLPDNQQHALQNESESEGGDDPRHEKLSREERKLQALMKQFEKLDKKNDTSKHRQHQHHKDGKTPHSRTTSISLDDPPTPVTNSTPQKVGSTTKKITNKRKSMGVNGKSRRTRQSSCSSEPVSPSEADHQQIHSNVSTPTSNASTTMESSIFTRQKARREKEPLTLTLPIQRRPRNENSLTSPTPPATPSLDAHHPSIDATNLSLMVETQLPISMESTSSTPVKTNPLGLLQIARNNFNNHPTASIGHSTAEEKIGNFLSRQDSYYETPLASPSGKLHQRCLQRQYYGSLKKHWLQKHSSPRHQRRNIKGSSEQICLAALIATLDPKRHEENAQTTKHVFKKPSNYIPLKKRYIKRAAQRIEAQQNRLVDDSFNSHKESNITNLLSNASSFKQFLPNGKGHTPSGLPPSSLGRDFSNDSSRDLQSIQSLLSDKLSDILTRKDSTFNGVAHAQLLTPQKSPKVTESSAPLVRTTNSYGEFMNGYRISNAVSERLMNSTNAILSTTISDPRLSSVAGTKRPSAETEEPLAKKIKSDEKESLISAPLTTTTLMTTLGSTPTHQELHINTTNNTQLSVVSRTLTPNPSTVATSSDLTSKTPETDESMTLNSMTSSPVKSATQQPQRRLSSSSSLASPGLDGVNMEFDQTGEQPASIKRKLSIKDYRNRRKVTSTAATSTPPSTTPNTSSYTLAATTSPSSISSISPGQKIHQAADALLTPNTLSLRDHQTSGYHASGNITGGNTLTNNVCSNITTDSLEEIKKRTYLGQNDSVPVDRKSNSDPRLEQHPLKVTSLDGKTLPNHTVTRKDVSSPSAAAPRRPSNERTVQLQQQAMFEPVSPLSDETLNSPKEEPSGNSIHSDITKNPFSIHNSITKHPFVKKQQQPTKPPAQDHNMLHENNVSTATENDEDTSSNHSSISSTSFGSGDVVHDRSSYSSYQRITSSASTNNSSRDTYTVGRDFYGHSNYGSTAYYPSSYQNFNNQHQPNNRQPPAAPGKRGHYIGGGGSTNTYNSQSNQNIRRPPQHNRFQHY